MKTLNELFDEFEKNGATHFSRESYSKVSDKRDHWFPRRRDAKNSYCGGTRKRESEYRITKISCR